jgi:hypothetical protein
VVEQGLAHGFGRDPRVREGRLELRIDLGVGLGQNTNVCLQLGQFFFAAAIATRGEIATPGDAGAPLVASARRVLPSR